MQFFSGTYTRLPVAENYALRDQNVGYAESPGVISEKDIPISRTFIPPPESVPYQIQHIRQYLRQKSVDDNDGAL